MKMNIQSIKFDADKQLVDFIQRKVDKLDKFFDGTIGIDVYLHVENTQDPANKKVEMRVIIPGNDLFVEKTCKTFEEATDECVEALKRQLVKTKEKMRS